MCHVSVTRFPITSGDRLCDGSFLCIDYTCMLPFVDNNEEIPSVSHILCKISLLFENKHVLEPGPCSEWVMCLNILFHFFHNLSLTTQP